MPYVLDDDVLRLEIPMNDAMTMDVANSLKDVAEDRYDLRLLQLLGLLDHLEQVAAGTVFHNEVDVLLIVEETVQLDDVWVVEVHLDLYLADEWDF